MSHLYCRELVHYRGEPDPFKGDALNQKVREAAKEALDAVFAPVDTSHTNVHQPAYAVPLFLTFSALCFGCVR